MLNIWKKNKLESIFKNAYEKGIILSGVSAGAVCWFDWILSDSAGPGFNPLRGINLISGSCTPHSSNIERINQFESDIKNDKLPQGIAIDDGVAVVFVDGKPTEVYSSRKNHTAYFLDKNKKINLEEYYKKYMNNIIASKKIHSLDDARNLAKKRMPKLMFDFVDGASGDEKLCEINNTALDQIRLEPKVLRNVENRNLKKKFLDIEFDQPFGFFTYGHV